MTLALAFIAICTVCSLLGWLLGAGLMRVAGWLAGSGAIENGWRAPDPECREIDELLREGDQA